VGFRYQYSNYQIEYSRNLGGHMDQVFQALIDRSRAPLDLKTIKTILGYRHRPIYRRRTKRSRIRTQRGPRWRRRTSSRYSMRYHAARLSTAHAAVDNAARTHRECLKPGHEQTLIAVQRTAAERQVQIPQRLFAKIP
jgi:hypothetical protein